jgi:hypothetical protein
MSKREFNQFSCVKDRTSAFGGGGAFDAVDSPRVYAGALCSPAALGAGGSSALGLGLAITNLWAGAFAGGLAGGGFAF